MPDKFFEYLNTAQPGWDEIVGSEHFKASDADTRQAYRQKYLAWAMQHDSFKKLDKKEKEKVIGTIYTPVGAGEQFKNIVSQPAAHMSHEGLQSLADVAYKPLTGVHNALPDKEQGKAYSEGIFDKIYAGLHPKQGESALDAAKGIGSAMLNTALIPTIPAEQYVLPKVKEAAREILGGREQTNTKINNKINRENAVTYFSDLANPEHAKLKKGVREVIGGIAAAPFEFAKLTGATMLTGNPLTAFAGTNMLSAYDPNKPIEEQIGKLTVAGGEGIVTGSLYEGAKFIPEMIPGAKSWVKIAAKKLAMFGIGAGPPALAGAPMHKWVADGLSIVILDSVLSGKGDLGYGVNAGDFIKKLGYRPTRAELDVIKEGVKKFNAGDMTMPELQDFTSKTIERQFTKEPKKAEVIANNFIKINDKVKSDLEENFHKYVANYDMPADVKEAGMHESIAHAIASDRKIHYLAGKGIKERTIDAVKTDLNDPNIDLLPTDVVRGESLGGFKANMLNGELTVGESHGGQKRIAGYSLKKPDAITFPGDNEHVPIMYVFDGSKAHEIKSDDRTGGEVGINEGTRWDEAKAIYIDGKRFTPDQIKRTFPQFLPEEVGSPIARRRALYSGLKNDPKRVEMLSEMSKDLGGNDTPEQIVKMIDRLSVTQRPSTPLEYQIMQGIEAHIAGENKTPPGGVEVNSATSDTPLVTAPNKEIEPITFTGVLRELRRIGYTIKKGKMFPNEKGQIGQHQPSSGGIRASDTSAPGVLSHEIAHDLYTEAKNDLPAGVDNELVDYATNNDLLTSVKGEAKPHEAFAELVSKKLMGHDISKEAPELNNYIDGLEPDTGIARIDRFARAKGVFERLVATDPVVRFEKSFSNKNVINPAGKLTGRKRALINTIMPEYGFLKIKELYGEKTGINDVIMEIGRASCRERV